jgi:hypothetical protein
LAIKASKGLKMGKPFHFALARAFFNMKRANDSEVSIRGRRIETTQSVKFQFQAFNKHVGIIPLHLICILALVPKRRW